MAIEKSNGKVSRFDSECSHGSDESTRSFREEERLELQSKAVAANVDLEDEDDDYDEDEDDSGAGSDDFDLLELSEPGTEFCQVGDVICSVPYELYDLSNLEDILSVDVWNECLSEEERFSLSKYLPDMDQITFMVTLKELFGGCSLHLGSPMKKLFEMLKGGKCDPRNVLLLEGRNMFQRTKHYHSLRKYHNDMVVNLCQMRDAWGNCQGYSINEKLRVLNIIKSQKTRMLENREDSVACNSGYGVDSGLEFPRRRQLMAVEDDRYDKPKSKLRREIQKIPLASGYNGLRVNSAYNTSSLVRQKYGSDLVLGSEDNIDDDDDDDQEQLFGMGSRRDRDNVFREKSGFSRHGKKHKFLRDREPISEHFMGPPYSSRKSHRNSSKSIEYANNIQPVKGSLADLRGDLYEHGNYHGDGFSADPRYISDNLSSKSKRLKSERHSSDFGESQVQEKIRVTVVPNARSGGGSRFMRNDDRELDSSEECDEDDEDEDRNRFMRNKLSVSVSGLNNSHFPVLKSGQNSNNSKFRKNGFQVNELLDGRGRGAYLKYKGAPGEHIFPPGTEKHSFKAKQKGMMRDRSPLNNFSSRDFEDGPIRPNKNSHTRDKMMGRPSARPDLSRRKGGFDEDDKSPEMRTLVNDNARGRLNRKYQVSEGDGNNGELEARLLVTCSAVPKKRKARGDMERREDNGELQIYSDIQQPIDDIIALKRNRKNKTEVGVGLRDLETSETPEAGKGESEAEVETKPQKKTYLLITPTVHTGFSFSIMHLLSAVRMAMISSHPKDSSDVSKPILGNGEHEAGENGAPMSTDAEDIKLPQQGRGNLPSIPIQEIVTCVKSNPGDPCILETQEPLQDLIRGVLKIFSSKTSPLGAKSWKPLVRYDKSTKCWSWIGPILSSTEQETVEEITSPDAWGLPHKMLVKLVDSFANWLKNVQDALQKIGSLPEPPLSLMQYNLDEKERVKDLKSQKSLSTIPQSSEEARAYFRKEEFLRYSIPDRVFLYTAADGKKSSVAPLIRGGGKPISKARDHFMLKSERPPHVTILCLVRDAAARLPGSIGTRADVCTLIRDSQYMVEDVTDAQVNQAVSGALDRLHYKKDPCVQFDSERKMWMYLHRGREEEEDFDEDGAATTTTSTKRLKRPKKEALEQTDEQEAVTVALFGNEEQTGIEMGPDPKTVDPTSSNRDQGAVAAENEEDVENTAQGNETTMWKPDPVEDNTIICRVNSADDDFDRKI